MTTLPSTIAAPSAAVVRIERADRAEAFRYLLASIAALGTDVAVLAVCVDLFGMSAWAGGAVAYFAGLVLIYGLSVRWVFVRRTEGNRLREFAVFAALGFFGLLLNSTTLYLATAAGLALPLAKALSAAIGFTTNFVSRKIVLFSGKAR